MRILTIAIALWCIAGVNVGDSVRGRELTKLQVEQVKLEIEKLKFELSIYREQEAANVSVD